MRRALVVCLAAVLAVVLFAHAQQEGPSGPEAAGHIQIVVVANNIAARALAVGPETEFLLSLAKPQDRFFEFEGESLHSKASPALAPVVGTGVAGSLGDGGAALSAQLDLAQSTLYARSGVVVAQDGSIYIADTQNATIRHIAGSASSEPGIIRSVAGRWGPKQNVALDQPLGISLDRAGNLYIADSAAGALDLLRSDTGALETVAQVAGASAVAVAPDGGRAFVSSSSTGSVLAVDLQSSSLTTLKIGAPEASSSSAANSSPCVSTSQNAFCASGLTTDAAGNLFVSDLWNGRIWRVDAQSGASAAVTTGLKEPGALAFDSTGRNLYVVEQGQSRIIALNGMGNTGNLSIAPATATFADEPIGGTSASQQFILTNNSASSVSGITTAFQSTASSATTDFTQQSSSCASPLLAGGTCTINVAFTPTTVGALSYSMTVADSSGDSTTTSLTGTGDDYQVQLASGQLQELSVIQGNSVTYHLQVAAIGAFGQNGEQVSFVCPRTIPAETTCTFSPMSVAPAPGSTVPFAVTFQTSSNNTHSELLPTFSLPSGFDGRLIPLLAPAYCVGALVMFRIRLRGIRLAAVAALALIAFVGCHHPTITSTPTPAGTVTMTVQGAALDKNGNPLNATRGVSIILDVIAK